MAEDEPVNREITHTLLADGGFEADVAEDGKAALALGAANDYRLVLMDVQMPQTSLPAAAGSVGGQYPPVERPTGEGQPRQGQRQQRQQQDAADDDAGQQQRPQHSRQEITEHHPYAGHHGADQASPPLAQQRHGKNRDGKKQEGDEQAGDAAPQQKTADGAGIGRHFGQPHRRTADHIAVEDGRIGDEDHEQQRADQRQHPQRRRRPAEAGEHRPHPAALPGLVRRGDAVEAGEEDRAEQHEGTGGSDDERRQATEQQAPENQRTANSEDQRVAERRAPGSGGQLPALTQGGTNVGGGERLGLHGVAGNGGRKPQPSAPPPPGLRLRSRNQRDS
jgi:hypothetical protein